jgi:hypothetical protein
MEEAELALELLLETELLDPRLTVVCCRRNC